MIRFSLQKKLNASDGEMILDVDCEIESGKLITLYGPSGSGKTSILRMLAGLFSPDSGSIEVNGNIWLSTKKKIALKPQQRNIGFVFQDYALFPNMTVKENLQYALAKKQDNSVIAELIEMIELGDLQNRKPTQLSGGQQQRVALARALVRQPEILMLDEPLSALGFKMRSKLQDYILKVHRQYNLTTILVSHELGEIFKMSDQVFVLEKGKITQQGKALEIFTNQKKNASVPFVGEIIDIEKRASSNIVFILLGNSIIETKIKESELKEFMIGDKVALTPNEWGLTKIEL